MAKQPRKADKTKQEHDRLCADVGDLARSIRNLCDVNPFISDRQHRALTEAHKWLAEFAIEEETYNTTSTANWRYAETKEKSDGNNQ